MAGYQRRTRTRNSLPVGAAADSSQQNPLTLPFHGNRVRKIRCDETSPVCNNCTKSGRRCDGVAEPVNKDGGLTFTAPLTLTHFRPTQTGWLTPQEIAHLDLFRHELVYSIVGHVGTPSWKRLILQAVHEEVALCHAVVAFTALSTSAAGSLLPGDGGSDSGGQGVAVSGAQSPLSHHASRENEFALRHYGKALEAMRHVFRHNDKRSINTALLCTLLCICFELRIKEPATALTHLEHGLQVVSSNLHTGRFLLSLLVSRTKTNLISLQSRRSHNNGICEARPPGRDIPRDTTTGIRSVAGGFPHLRL